LEILELSAVAIYCLAIFMTGMSLQKYDTVLLVKTVFVLFHVVLCFLVKMCITHLVEHQYSFVNIIMGFYDVLMLGLIILAFLVIHSPAFWKTWKSARARDARDPSLFICCTFIGELVLNILADVTGRKVALKEEYQQYDNDDPSYVIICSFSPLFSLETMRRILCCSRRTFQKQVSNNIKIIRINNYSHCSLFVPFVAVKSQWQRQARPSSRTLAMGTSLASTDRRRPF